MKSTGTQKWLRITIACPELILEPVADILGVLSGSGVELEPVKKGKSLVSSFFQLEEGNSGEDITSQVDTELTSLFALYDEPPPQLVCSYFEDEDWATSWQQFFKPFSIIPGLVIKPSWEPYEKKEAEQIIEMDPGMAFGTGRHASTRLALQLIHSCFQKNAPSSVLDVGTGTGILAMASALFGAERIDAIDNDPEAVRVCVENCNHNGFEGKITVSSTDITRISGDFDLICANIVHNVLVEMLPDFSRLLDRGAHLILAGILKGSQEKSIITQAKKHSFSSAGILYDEEWAGLHFIKASPE